MATVPKARNLFHKPNASCYYIYRLILIQKDVAFMFDNLSSVLKPFESQGMEEAQHKNNTLLVAHEIYTTPCFHVSN